MATNGDIIQTYKLWIDDVRTPPDSTYTWLKKIDEIINFIRLHEHQIKLLDIDHDAGIYCIDNKDYIEILNYIEETGRNYPIRIHSMNPVGVENMRRIIRRNGWTEVL